VSGVQGEGKGIV